MKIYYETSLINFKAWGGAVNTLNGLTFKQCNELEAMLEEYYPEGMSATQLNDILWFEEDWIAELLGFKNWEHLERANKGYNKITVKIYNIHWVVEEEGLLTEEGRARVAALPKECNIEIEDEEEIAKYLEDKEGYIENKLEEIDDYFSQDAFEFEEVE